MEILGVIAGMALAFLLGAYVRKPFTWRKAQTAQAMPREEEQENRRRDKVAQLNNLLSYTGRAQTEEEFEN